MNETKKVDEFLADRIFILPALSGSVDVRQLPNADGVLIFQADHGDACNIP